MYTSVYYFTPSFILLAPSSARQFSMPCPPSPVHLRALQEDAVDTGVTGPKAAEASK